MRALEKVIDCPPSCARLQIKAHWRNKRRKDGIEKVRSIYPLHPTFLCTTFLTILAGTNFDHLSSLLFSSGILRQLCSHKMYLRYFRFKGHEQIEETLVANEDKHGAGGREKLYQRRVQSGILSVLSRGSNSSKLCKQVSYRGNFGNRFFPFRAWSAGGVGRVDSSRIFFLFFFPFRSIKVKIQKLNSNPFRNTFHRYFNLRLEIKNV